MKKLLGFAVSAIFLAASLSAFGADFWEKKEYTKWSARECAKMLTNSPWAQDYSLQPKNFGASTKASEDGQQFQIVYQIQFSSALPIRQAQVRQGQIVQNYDKLTPEQKQQFDKNASAFLSRKYDAVILSVSYSTNNQSVDRELARYWQAQTADLLKNYVFLRNSNGDRVDIVQYSVSQAGERSFLLIFPRQKSDGTPLIGPEDKSLQLQFKYPATGNNRENTRIEEGTAYMEFKPQKMVYKGEVAF